MLLEYKDLINPKLLPKKLKYLHYYIVGFVDAEGCFSVSIKKQETAKFGWIVDPIFYLLQKDKKILEILKRTLKCGRIERKHGQDLWQWIVDNRKQIKEKILPFFKKNKLIVKKERFLKFAEIVEGLERKEHYTKEGLIKLIKKSYELSNKRKRQIEEIIKNLK